MTGRPQAIETPDPVTATRCTAAMATSSRFAMSSTSP